MQEDTDLAVALAEEERDTCPSCGMPKVWCSDPANQFAFEPHERMCFPTWRLAQMRESDAWKSKHAATQQATQVAARFRDGHEPVIDAGLGLEDEETRDEQQRDDREDST